MTTTTHHLPAGAGAAFPLEADEQGPCTGLSHPGGVKPAATCVVYLSPVPCGMFVATMRLCDDCLNTYAQAVQHG